MFKKVIKGVVLLGVLFSVCACGQMEESVGQEVLTEHSLSDKAEEQGTGSYEKPEMKGEITISCFFEEEFLNIAAKQFMDRYPDVRVTVNAYDQTTQSGSVESYQTYLNTKIMSGKAEDLIFNSFLPVEKYSEMGAFEDLSHYISNTPEWTEEHYFMNVLTSAKEENGEIYLLPYMAKFDVIGFSEDLLGEQPEPEMVTESTGFSKRMELAKHLYQNAGKSNVYLIQLNPVSYANYLIEDAFEDFVDTGNKNVSFNSNAYIKLIEEVKQLSQDNAFGLDLDFYNEEYEYASICDYDVQAAFYELDTAASVSSSMPVTNREGKAVINANTCLAMSSSSKNKALAWEFVKFLLSEEIQSQPSMHGLTVNKRGFEAAVERYYGFYTEGGNEAVDKESYKKLLESWMEQVGDCDTTDPALWSLIEEENTKFFEGQQSAKDTASVLQRKVEQYFYE